MLTKLETLKAVTLEELPGIDNKAKAALTYNKKTLIETVTKEWFAERVSEEDPTKKIRCGLCNTPNKYLYYIRNRKNGKLLNVGSYCITKFPGIEGYIEQKQQLNQMLKGHKIVYRRNEFYEKFPECENFINNADKYFANLPILLPYDLYIKLQDNIVRMRQIYSSYVNDGKKPFQSELDSFELFKLAIEQYKKLKLQADTIAKNSQHLPLICRRREIDWLISNNKQFLLRQIAENKGIYTLDTLKYIYSSTLIKENLELMLSRNSSTLFKFDKMDNNQMICSFNKFGYHPSVQFTISINKFMNNIGANCIINKNYTYGSEEIMEIADIISSTQNVDAIFSYTFYFLKYLNCALLFDNSTYSIILYRKGDRAIRIFNINKFLIAYSRNILRSDNEIKSYLYKLVKGNHNTKWITPKEQAKQGIDDKVNKLYKDYSENASVGRSLNTKRIEIMLYKTENKSDVLSINFDKPEYIILPIDQLSVPKNQIQYIDYAIYISDNSRIPYFQSGDILFVQNTKNVKNNSQIFFASDEGIETKRCYTKEANENIFDHIPIRKSKLQSYGRIIGCEKFEDIKKRLK